MTPGSNLLKRASKLIRFSEIPYYQYKSRSLNQARQWIAIFNLPIQLSASVQAVNRSSYTALGLDLQRNYVTVFASLDIIDLQRDSSGDQFIYNGAVFQIESQNTWYAADGWASCLAVEIGKGTTPMTAIP